MHASQIEHTTQVTNRILLAPKVFICILCPSVSLSQHLSNRLISLSEQGMLGNLKGATGTSQTDGDVVCVEHVCVYVCVWQLLAGVKRLWIYQLPNEGQKQRLPDPTLSRTQTHTSTSCLTSSSISPSLLMLVFI